ncbi:Vegetative incompatibility protein HET-E-1 [Mycena sanguinolenta]|uniref:Vegetative incompatibility protein HET-E-1 n=1 Tax=Mycena sanguinolenta TaxID=230812 RepID=A0A8H7DM22_9AGAR|nr:Vegetative incompatibility protein HET-E-1 [Mycena sanguinolenta]
MLCSLTLIPPRPLPNSNSGRPRTKNSPGRNLAQKIDAFLEWKPFTAAQEFIPNSPFPAKTLVKFLLTITHVAISIPVIQQKTYDFAAEAIEYTRALFEAAKGEPTLQKNLETIQKVVNDICIWASEHVSKNQLSKTALEEWASMLEKAKENFKNTAQLEEIVNQARYRRMEFIKEKLKNKVATLHEHTVQKKSLCAENTRVELQAQIMQWLSDPSKEQIFWVTGIAGSGKSTLSATIVEKLREKTPVAAQFFISRNIPETIDAKKLVPTIALQLAEFSPAAACTIEAALKHGLPGLQKDQVEKLLLAPIQEICKSYDRAIILIDALDELQDAAVVVPKLLSLLAPKSKNSDLPDKLRVIVTSRPEHWAVISSYDSLNHAVFKQEALTTDMDEFRSFIVARFKEIKEELNIKGPGWDNWPSDAQVSKLSTAADGLFHYAATALKWIQEEIGINWEDSREWVFEKFNELGTGELRTLYRVILTSFENIDIKADDEKQRNNRLRGFHHVIGTILVVYKPLTIGQIIALSPQEGFDVKNFLLRGFSQCSQSRHGYIV